ncbi:MAG: ATP-binding protein, partial [Candidatus Methanofastidiosia archaeon]
MTVLSGIIPFVAEGITILGGVRFLGEKLSKRIAAKGISEATILEYFYSEFVSEFGRENFEDFRKWIEEKGVSRRSIIDFLIGLGYEKSVAEAKTETLLLQLPRNIAEKFGNSEIRDLFRALIDTLQESKADLSVNIEDLLISYEEQLNISKKLLDLYSERRFLIPPKVFEFRSENKDLKYTFVGRKKELAEIKSFVDKGPKVMAVFGEGGCGKTRFLIEFARSLESSSGNDQHAYFVNPEYFGPVSVEDAILILDDASRHRELDKIIDLAENPETWGSRRLKLIISDRTYFKKETCDRLKSKNIEVRILDLKGGDIEQFLKVNFGVTENAEIIAAESLYNFFFASIMADYVLKGGEIDLLEALEYRVEKYIEDLKRDSRYPELENMLYLISLVMPVDMNEDIHAFRQVLGNCTNLLQVLESDVVRTVGETKFAIKPDPVGDYVRFKFMSERDNLFDHYVTLFLLHMPFRILYNIVTTPEFSNDMALTKKKMLARIWKKLNMENFDTQEFFYALLLFTGNVRDLVSENIAYMDISRWIETFSRIGNSEIAEILAKGLYNASNFYRTSQNFPRMEESLQELRTLLEQYKTPEIAEELAKGLYNASNFYRTSQNFPRMEESLQELRT